MLRSGFFKYSAVSPLTASKYVCALERFAVSC